MIVAIGSVKGSPGATTFAAALAAVWPSAVLVEADPAGGDLGAWLGIPDTPSLSHLAADCRNGPVDIARYTTRLPFGLSVVVAPSGAGPARAAVELLAEQDPGRWAKEWPVVVDVGRFDRASSRLCARADLLMIVSRGDLAQLAHIRGTDLPGHACLVLIGPAAFPPAQVAMALDREVVVGVPWDGAGADVIAGRRRATRGWNRVGLAAAARSVADRIGART